MSHDAPAVRHPDGAYHEANGHRLWVESEGQGDPVLLLAGLGPAGSHVVFHPHFDALASDHRVLYVDLHGRGRSDTPDDLTELTFARDVADIAALLTTLDLGPVHLYGFSYGGLLGQALALDHPETVRTLTLANSLHSPQMWQLNHENINRELELQFPEVWARITALRERGVPSTDPAMQAEFAAAVKPVRFHNPDHASLLATEPGARNLALYPLFCGADVDFTVGGEIPRIPDFRPRLAEIEAPLMVLAGRYDRALYPALQREFVEWAPRTRFEMLERSGSFGHVEEPETVHTLLREFWKEH
ncbi:alpha/beta hydrolase [Streptomyces sp. NBC_01525]|uniref:alpha/beta fold hydrolase n=1 Tax=Streptomyces sp. NBC_01525 TaxID=2903893 RepID=UPI00386901B6